MEEKVVDERQDPYSGRGYQRETRAQRLAEVVRRERGVERIVRNRTWGVVEGRCRGEGRGWEEVLGDWEAANGKGQGGVSGQRTRFGRND